MACCRGNRPENGLAFPALPGESTHADMQLTTTRCTTGSGIFSLKCQRSEQPPGAILQYQGRIRGLMLCLAALRDDKYGKPTRVM